MKLESALLKGLRQVEDCWATGLHGQALAIVDGLLELSPANPALLVRRAQLIQLSDGGAEHLTLDRARADLELAARIEPGTSLPQTELASFTFAVDDDAGRAERQFRRAVETCQRLLREALLGRARALMELNRESEALACLAEAHGLPADGTDTDAALLDEFRALVQLQN